MTLLSVLRARLRAPEREALKAKRPGPAQQIIERARQRGEATLALYEAEGATLKSIAAEMGISFERVRQIIFNAKRRQAAAHKANGTPADATLGHAESSRAVEAGSGKSRRASANPSTRPWAHAPRGSLAQGPVTTPGT